MRNRHGSGTICFLLCNRPFIHTGHAGILQGAASEAEALGVHVVYATCSYSPDTPSSEIELPRILSARGLIDGVVLAGTNYPNILKAIEDLGLPYVLFGTNLVTENDAYVGSAVYVNSEEGGYQATAHLLSLGHRKIIFIGDVSQPWHRRRYQGFVRAMTEAGLHHSSAVGFADKSDLKMGFDAVNDLCDRGEEFTALFVSGDMGAYGAMRALSNRGIRVPEDVSVVGFSDMELAQLTDPPLTTIRVPKQEIGARCMDMLNAAVSSGSLRRQPEVLPVQLVLRMSTARCRIEAADTEC
ncbi:MAG: LacI family DNA-binding transcriptional regulator [Armatimonadota bacterium]